MLASTAVNYGMIGWNKIRTLMPEWTGTGAPLAGIGGADLRLIQVWVIAGMAAALIMSVVAVVMRFVTAQTRLLMETPQVRIRIHPPVTVLLDDDKGEPSEHYTLEVDLQLFADSRDALMGEALDNLRLAMAELIKSLIDEAFRQITPRDLERHFMVLCRDSMGAGVVTGVTVVSTSRRPYEGSPDGELEIPAQPAARQPVPVDPEKEAADQAEVTAMREQMRIARERALAEAAEKPGAAAGKTDD
ncbi:MAG: hypothetical protein EXQ92_07815 [Alphaproteobacteria bacterium]|nr:hypothetical protein [Alphaproteobacteria bacterium]